MGGCGTFASGNNVAYTYETVGMIEDAKILQGIPGKGKHGLPEESHSPNAKYIKLDRDVFKEMRIYNEQKQVVLEIAYHREGKLNSLHAPILHYHTYKNGDFKTRSEAKILTEDLWMKYKKYLKGVKR